MKRSVIEMFYALAGLDNTDLGGSYSNTIVNNSASNIRICKDFCTRKRFHLPVLQFPLCSLLFVFLDQNILNIPHFTHAFCMSRPSHPSCYNIIN
jgi:hypothetical protein